MSLLFLYLTGIWQFIEEMWQYTQIWQFLCYIDQKSILLYLFRKSPNVEIIDFVLEQKIGKSKFDGLLKRKSRNIDLFSQKWIPTLEREGITRKKIWMGLTDFRIRKCFIRGERNFRQIIFSFPANRNPVSKNYVSL